MKRKTVYLGIIFCIALVWSLYSPTIEIMLATNFNRISLTAYNARGSLSELITVLVFSCIFVLVNLFFVATEKDQSNPIRFLLYLFGGTILFAIAIGNIYYWRNWNSNNEIGLKEIWFSFSFLKGLIISGIELAVFPLLVSALIVNILRKKDISKDSILPSWLIKIEQIFSLFTEN